jgi:hypothetical protein
MKITQITNEILEYLRKNEGYDVMTDSYYKTVVTQGNPQVIEKWYSTKPYTFLLSDDKKTLWRSNDNTEKTKYLKI